MDEPTIQPSDDGLDLLTELSEDEADYDVDLMACGCRVQRIRAEALEFSIDDLLRLYNLDDEGVAGLIGGLIDAGKIEPETVFKLAEKASRGELRERGSKFANPRAAGRPPGGRNPG